MKLQYANRQMRMVSDSMTVVCAILFAVFAFRFLYVGQCDIIALMHFISQNDASPMSLFGGILICVLIISLPALFLIYLIHYPTSLRALAWYPSFSLLAGFTSCDIVDCNQLKWNLWMPAIFLVLSLLAQGGVNLVREYRNERNTLLYYLTWNFVLMIVPIVFTLFLSNQNIEIHKTLKAERVLQERKYDDVLDLSFEDNKDTPLMTAMRALILSKRGALKETISCYPVVAWEGKKKSESLLPPNCAVTRLYRTDEIISKHLGYVRADDKMPVRRFLEKAMEMELEKDTIEDSPRPYMPRLQNYYDVALMLDQEE